MQQGNFYVILLQMTLVLAVVFVVMLFTMTMINYFGLKYQVKQQEKEEKKKEEMGIEYFFQEENTALSPIKDEEFKEIPENLFDDVIKAKTKK